MVISRKNIDKYILGDQHNTIIEQSEEFTRYTIYDTENEKVEIIPNTSSHKGGTKLPADLLQGHGIDIMICGGLGRRAIQLFEQFGIEVYSGAKGTIADAIKQFEDGSLTMTTDADACREHKYHDESKHKK